VFPHNSSAESQQVRQTTQRHSHSPEIMSGIETALGVYGLITGTITIIDTSIQIYDAVKDKSGIPEKLRKVSETLPSLKELLRGAEAQFNKDQPDEEAWISVGKDVQRCNEACRELQDLLSRAYPEEQASRARRFAKAATTILSGKGKTSEQLLKEIQGYLEVLLDRQILTNALLLEDFKATVDELLPQHGQVVQNNVNGDKVGRDKKSYAHSGSEHMFTGDNGTFHIGGTSIH
jgi:hypothetical protein